MSDKLSTPIQSIKTLWAKLSSKTELDELFETPIDPEDRTTKNVIKMMLEDGLTMAIPGGRDGYINFLTPFLRIIKKEKNYFKTQN